MTQKYQDGLQLTIEDREEVGFFNRAIVRVDRDELSIAHRPWPWFGALRRNGRMLHLEARPFRDSS